MGGLCHFSMRCIYVNGSAEGLVVEVYGDVVVGGGHGGG